MRRSSTSNKVFWCYESKRQRHTWWKYDERTTDYIEDAYQKWTKNTNTESAHVDLQIAGKIYRIDFEAREQYLANGHGRQRLIQRSSDLVDGCDTIVGTAGIKEIK